MNPKELRILYMGTPDFAVYPLRRLVDQGYNVVGVVTMPDKPAGRGLKLQASAVKRYAEEAGLPVFQPEKLRDPHFLEQLSALDLDLGIVIAFRMLPEVVWAMPRLGTFNLHASLLPQYRGAAPINWAIMNGDSESGVTTFLLNHEIDKGDMLVQAALPITERETAGTLHDKLMELGGRVVLETVDKLAAGELTPITQTEGGELRPAPKLFKEDGRIDWSRSGVEILRLIRGLSPYPAAWTPWSRSEEAQATLKIYAASFAPASHNLAVGCVRLVDGALQIACSDGFIAVEELQAAGKRRMAAADYLRGVTDVECYQTQS